MTISLNPEHQKLVEKKIQAGEFPSPEALVEFALNRFLGTMGRIVPALSAEERVNALGQFFTEVDSDPSSANGPVPDEALRRRNLYDDHRNRR